MKKQRNTIGLGGQLKLRDYILGRHDELRASKTTREDVAAQASAALEMHVSVGNVEGLLTAQPELRWIEHKVKPAPEPIADLFEKIALERRIATLEAHVQLLANEFGINLAGFEVAPA